MAFKAGDSGARAGLDIYLLPDCRIYCSGHRYTVWIISVEHKETDDLANTTVLERMEIA